MRICLDGDRLWSLVLLPGLVETFLPFGILACKAGSSRSLAMAPCIDAICPLSRAMSSTMVLLGLDPLGLGFVIEPEASVEGTEVT